MSNSYKKKWSAGFKKYGFKSLLIALVVFTLMRKDFSIRIDLTANPDVEQVSPPTQQAGLPASLFAMDVGSSLLQAILPNQTDAKASPKKANSPKLANTYSNMTYHKVGNKEEDLKKQKQMAYVQRFAKVAQAEMAKYGIPASITLAQGLIESNAGASRLSNQNNNHFGIKCFSRSCRKGHCSNFTDDSHKDFFRIYKTAWESYRAHSLMLQGKRYQSLKSLDKDYKAWAHGLKKAGYATDPRYAEKLIHIIEELQLHQYD
ncbi:MAG: glucosaminidase domain-containing protein [Bacteroidota bacterium]